MTTKPKILHVFDGFRVGGTEVRTCSIINYLGSDYHHLIISSNGNFEAKSLIRDTVSIDYIQPDFVGKSRVGILYQISLLLKQIEPDLMVAYEWGAIDWVMVNSLLKVCPTLMTIEGFEETELFRQKKSRWLLRYLFYRRCAKVVACSDKLCELAGSSWKLTGDQVLHIPNGINCSRFLPVTEQEEESGGIILGIVASLIKLKNHQKLLKSMATLSGDFPVSLVVVGDGIERHNLEEQCQHLGITDRVNFVGHLQNPSSILQKLDIFCLPSDTEQMPMVVLEAMATGLPIAGTDVGDVKEMVASVNREFIVDHRDEEAFTLALVKLCRDEKLRKSVGQENLKKCQEFYDEQVMFQKYRSLYETTIALSK